jgi:hypothetical protein
MASSTASSTKKKGRAYRGWITAEEMAEEGQLGGDAMDVDEEGRPYVTHTSKAKYKEAQDAVRAVFFRQTAVKSHKGRLIEDGVDDEDVLWKGEERSSKQGGRGKKRAVSDNFKSDKTEAKMERRVKSGRAAIESAGQGKTGRVLLVERVKGLSCFVFCSFLICFF